MTYRPANAGVLICLSALSSKIDIENMKKAKMELQINLVFNVCINTKTKCCFSDNQIKSPEHVNICRSIELLKSTFGVGQQSTYDKF